jgi:hypothetical protein
MLSNSNDYDADEYGRLVDPETYFLDGLSYMIDFHEWLKRVEAIGEARKAWQEWIDLGPVLYTWYTEPIDFGPMYFDTSKEVRPLFDLVEAAKDEIIGFLYGTVTTRPVSDEEWDRVHDVEVIAHHDKFGSVRLTNAQKAMWYRDKS